MKEWIEGFNWNDSLNHGKRLHIARKKMKHERFKYRLISFLENTLFGGKRLFDHYNWKILKP